MVSHTHKIGKSSDTPGIFMLIIKWSGLGVTDGRNKLGGNVLSKSRAGATARNKVTPVNRQSAAQQSARVAFAFNSSAWKGLTESQQNGWIAAATNFTFRNIFGDPIKPAGNALYVSLNSNLHTIGISPIDDAPPSEAVANPTSLVVTTNTDSAQVITLDAAIAADTSVVVWATPPVSPGRRFVKNDYRIIGTFAAAHAAALDTFAMYNAKYGAPITGQRIGFQVIAINEITGQAGVPLNVQDITA